MRLLNQRAVIGVLAIALAALALAGPCGGLTIRCGDSYSPNHGRSAAASLLRRSKRPQV